MTNVLLVSKSFPEVSLQLGKEKEIKQICGNEGEDHLNTEKHNGGKTAMSSLSLFPDSSSSLQIIPWDYIVVSKMNDRIVA